jgi:ABC-2 type transport system ATP-binding protein
VPDSTGGVAIRASGVSKVFRGQRPTSLKEHLLRRAGRVDAGLAALRDITVEIEAGHTVGLIGPNGSGKSTLLKVLAGILRPSTGEVAAYGRIASLLELGAGFNGELSGRDNVFLNASLLGLSHRETARLFDSIVAFSELEDFIDNPVKHYSSGMYVRLGFSVAVHVDPDILLVDEVLAVGDEAFAKKCLDKIAEFQAEGRTILFVSHALDLVQQICDRGIVLDHGRIVFDGEPLFATGWLRSIFGVGEPRVVAEPPPDEGLRFGEIVVSDQPGGSPRDEFGPHEPLAIRLELELSDSYAATVRGVQVTVMGVGNIPVFAMEAGDQCLPTGPGRWVLDFTVTDCPPLSGRFIVGVQLTDAAGRPLAHKHSGRGFRVEAGHRFGILRVPYTVDANARVVSR